MFQTVIGKDRRASWPQIRALCMDSLHRNVRFQYWGWFWRALRASAPNQCFALGVRKMIDPE